MSLIDDVSGQVVLGRIPQKIKEYELLIDAAQAAFELNGRNLEELCKQHAQNLMAYDVMLQECKTIEDTVHARVEAVEGDLYKFYNENYKVKLSTTEIRQYIKGDEKYTQAYTIMLEVIYTKRRLEAIVEALKTLGWSLNNIVKLRIAQLEHVTL